MICDMISMNSQTWFDDNLILSLVDFSVPMISTGNLALQDSSSAQNKSSPIRNPSEAGQGESKPTAIVTLTLLFSIALMIFGDDYI